MSKETITVTPRGAGKREIDRLRAELMISNMERDFAQREICERNARENRIVSDPISAKGFVINTPEREARLRGWDCFKEGNKTC
jgi:hypothetical protein